MSEIIVLMDEEGKEHEFELEIILNVEEHKYAVLIPMDEDYAESNEAIIMRFGMDEEGEEVLFDIEDDEEWDKVADAYDELLDSLEDDEFFVGDEDDEDDEYEEDEEEEE